MRSPRRLPLLCAALVAATALLLLGAGGAGAASRPLLTGLGGIGQSSAGSLAEVRDTGAQMLRIAVPWNDVAPKQKPASWNPEDPGDPSYNFDFLDQEVREAYAAGLTPYLLIEGPPRWAQRCKSPPNLQIVETCDPDPVALAQFATAAARRYNGSFHGLPAVRYWQGLNEPNLTLFFYPQFTNSLTPLAANLYRTLINSFYTAVKGVSNENVVIAAGLGPIAVRGATVGPMQFTRELLCMKGNAHPKPVSGCAGGVHFDAFDIHPYTTGGPTHRGGPDDVELGDLPKLARLLRAADRAGHIKGSGGRTQLWVGEFSWDSKPPDPHGLPMKIETRWISEALHDSWLAGVSHFVWYGLHDEPLGKDPGQSLQSGLYFNGGRPKLALQGFKFPLVAYPGGKLAFWGRTPTATAGKVELQAKDGGGWRHLANAHANRFGIFQGKVGTSFGRDQKGSVRAVFGGQKSAPFAMKPVPDFHIKPFG